MQYSFRAFSFLLPVPECCHSTDTKRLQEITIDCLTYRRSNPFNDAVDIWTEIESVWCKGVDVFPLLKGELISYEDSKFGTLDQIVFDYGLQAWSGDLRGVKWHRVVVNSRVWSNMVIRQLSVAAVKVCYDRIIHEVYIERVDKNIIERYYYQEPGNILINDVAANNIGPEIWQDLYNRVLEHNNNSLQELYHCMVVDNGEIAKGLDAYKQQLEAA